VTPTWNRISVVWITVVNYREILLLALAIPTRQNSVSMDNNVMGHALLPLRINCTRRNSDRSHVWVCGRVKPFSNDLIVTI
jgi:hypothetical protein